jgi:hypothetical protein
VIRNDYRRATAGDRDGPAPDRRTGRASLATLDRFIENDRYPPSHRIRALREIRAAQAVPGTPAALAASDANRAAEQGAV